jgi:hypothetical protein
MLEQVRAHWFWFAAASIALAAVGCSAITSFSGLSGSDDDAGTSTLDATSDATTSADGTMPSADTGADVGPTICNPQQTITAAFTTDLGPFTAYSTIPNYPKVESYFGDTALTLIPFRDTSLVDAGPDADPVPKQSEYADSQSDLWLTTPVPLTSFDVSFEAQIRCTSGSSCADGLIFAWLDSTNANILTNKNYGSGGGLPDFTAGAGIDIDNYKNEPAEQNDPYAPSLQIIQLDPAQKIGVYAWQKAIEKLSFADAWHKYTIKQRAGSVTLFYDGVMQLTANVPAVKTGIVGWGAGVGGESDSVAIRNASATFYDCVAP